MQHWQPEHTCNVGLAQQASLDTTTHVVLGWHDWDRLLGDVNATALTLSGNVWEVAHDLHVTTAMTTPF